MKKDKNNEVNITTEDELEKDQVPTEELEHVTGGVLNPGAAQRVRLAMRRAEAKKREEERKKAEPPYQGPGSGIE